MDGTRLWMVGFFLSFTATLFDGVPVLDVGQTALLSFTVILILTGRLVPRKVYKDLRDDYDKVLESHSKNTDQLEKLLTHAEVTNAILKALPRPPEDDKES